MYAIRSYYVSKGTLYLYYPGKADLLKAVVRQSLLGNLAEAQSLASEQSRSCRELLAFFLEEFTRRISRTRISGIPKLILAESGNFPEIAQFVITSYSIHYTKLYEARTVLTAVSIRWAASSWEKV